MIAHLINTDVGNRGVLGVYLDYRRENPNFLLNSAKMLLDNYGRVLIITGFPVPPTMRAETDGPPGALALAKAIEALGGKAEVMTYPEVREALKPFRVNFVQIPDVGEYSLVIAVEIPGRAPNGKYYSMSGLEIKRETFDWAVIEAQKLGIPTIGIGDGGNEAGMGRIRELIERHVPHGKKIASVVETDELILSAVSNWGAYGLVAEASIELGINLLADWDEEKTVTSMMNVGLIDGISKKLVPTVDGVPLRVHVEMVNLLKEIFNLRVIK